MYAQGMTVREIQAFLAEMYSVEVSPELISSVTDAVLSVVTAWQSRPLEAMLLNTITPRSGPADPLRGVLWCGRSGSISPASFCLSEF